MSRKAQYLIVAGFLLFAAAGLSAQTVQELRLGSYIAAILREDDEHWYSVRVSEQCFVVVETSGDEVDTCLAVFDSSNNVIAEDDDGGEGVNARVEFYASPGMTYRLMATGYSSYDVGPYRIWASQKPLPRPTELRVGASHSGNLSEGGDFWYRVIPSGSGFLVVETSSDMDTYLEAYDTSYKLIAYDDDGGDINNARLELFMESGKTYLIKLKTYGDWDSGPYTIRASQLPPPSELRVGGSHSGNIAEGRNIWYRITPSSSGLIVIETSSELDTYLEAYDSSNNFIDYDDDGGSYSNARLELYVDAGKTYLIKLRAYSGYDSGPYRIWVDSSR